MKTVSVIVFAVAMTFCMAAIAQSHQTEDSLKEFQTTAVLTMILTQCDKNPEVIEKKNNWFPFTIEYGNFLVEKNKIANDTIAQIFAATALSIDEQYGEEIPTNVCHDALEKTLDMSKSWQNSHTSETQNQKRSFKSKINKVSQV